MKKRILHFKMEFIYFFITYQRKTRENEEDIYFVKPEKESEQPECIYWVETYENSMYNYRKIFIALNIFL